MSMVIVRFLLDSNVVLLAVFLCSLENKLLEELNITPNEFQQLIGKYQNHREVQEVFYVMKVMNMRLLQKHGIHLPEEAM